MTSSVKNYIYILLFVVLSSFLVWLPFIQQLSFLGVHIPNTNTGLLYRNFDGLLYVIASKSWYKQVIIDSLHFDVPLAAKYYAAHLPLYPAIISLFALVMGYVKSMMFTTVLSSVMLGWFFYYFIKKLRLSEKPLLLTFVFLMLPRFLVVRSVGSPESLFMLLVLVSIFFFEKKNYLVAGVAGGLATMTKLPGVLLFPAFTLALFVPIASASESRLRVGRLIEVFKTIVAEKFERLSLWLLIIPAGLVAVCLIYQKQMGDFFAYWNTGYVVPMPYPYSAFNAGARWVGTHWLEEAVLYFTLYALTVVYAYKHRVKSLFYFSLVFFVGLIFVQHRDISRYALPLWPITCIIFERFLTSKKTLLAFLVIVPAIYLYAWTFIQGNAMPVSNWAPFL